MLCNQYIQIPCDVEGNIYLNGIKIMSSSHNIGNCFTNPTLATITHKHKLAKLSCLKILSLEENIDFSMSISGFNSPFFDRSKHPWIADFSYLNSSYLFVSSVIQNALYCGARL